MFVTDRQTDKIYLYGFGRLCKEFLESYLYRDKIGKIFDADPAKKGQKFLGIEITGLDELQRLDRGSLIVLTLAQYTELKKILEEQGFYNIQFVYSLRNDCNVKWQDHYCLHLPFDKALFSEIKKVKALLGDARSKDIMEKIIEHRQNENFDYSDICSSDKQYFPNIAAFKISEDEVFLDVGAYNGDTLNCFNEFTKGRWKAIYCFEIRLPQSHWL